MNVGVLGSGVVGQTLAAGFAKHGHQVMLGTRKPKEAEIQAWVTATPGARVGTFAETAAFGDLVVLAVLGRIVDQVIALAESRNFEGKAVIDTTNPISDGPPVNGLFSLFTGPNDSLGERLQALLPGAHIVKAFNSVGNGRMVNPVFEQGKPTMFYCGDNEVAKAKVAEVIQQFGWEPFDCGKITSSRCLEPLVSLWCLPGFLRNQWTHAFKVLTH
jgi:predicted dinucleotide-binding enzyme